MSDENDHTPKLEDDPVPQLGDPEPADPIKPEPPEPPAPAPLPDDLGRGLREADIRLNRKLNAALEALADDAAADGKRKLAARLRELAK